jgi:hypothetical protein
MTRKEFLRLTGLMIVSTFSVIGLLTEILGHAASPEASVEAENGTLSGSAHIVADSSASGGEAVQFGTVTTTNSTNPFKAINLYNYSGGIKLSSYASHYGASAPADYDEGFNESPYPGETAAVKALTVFDEIPMADWFGGWNTSDPDTLEDYLSAALSANQLPVVVIYNIPDRDDAGIGSGAASVSAYEAYIDSMVAAKKSMTPNLPVAVIIEPDAVAMMPNTADPTGRAECLNYACKQFSRAGCTVYLDSGNSGWLSAATATSLLIECGVQYCRGFSTNVSNFFTSAEEITYGNTISASLATQGYSNKCQVIDTSRNGSGAWTTDTTDDTPQYNPPGRSMGQLPSSAVTGGSSVQDAVLYVKSCGTTDKEGIRSPSDTTVVPDYVVDLSTRTSWFPAFTSMPETTS